MLIPDMTPKQLLEQLEAAKKRGDIDGQIESLRQLLSWAQQSRNVGLEIEVLRWLGNAYQEKGQLRRAHSYRVTAAELVEDPNSQCPPQLQMKVEGDLGRSYIEARNWPSAESYTQRALEMAESLGNERAQCIYKINLGFIYFYMDHKKDTDCEEDTERDEDTERKRMERRREAFNLGDGVLRVAERLQDHYILGWQHLNLASFFTRTAQLNDSQRHALHALTHADLAGNAELRVRAQRALGESFQLARRLTSRREYSDDAEQNLQKALSLARKLGNSSLEADAEIELAWLCQVRRQPTEAANHYRRALELLEKVRSNLGYEEFQLTYFRSFEPIYNGFTEFLLRQGQPDQAFLTAERLRSRLLLALLGQGRSNTNSWSPVQQRELKDTLNLYGREVVFQCFDDDTPELNHSVTVGLQSIDDDEATSDALPVSEARQSFLRLYESQRLHRASWQPQQSPPVVGFEKAQRFLGQDDALLSYLVTAQSVVIFVATNQARHFQHLAYPREKITNDVEELCSAMNAVQDPVLDEDIYEKWMSRQSQDPWPNVIDESMARLHRILEKLYALLVAPVLAVVDGKSHWVIIPHGPLHRLPWAALRGKGKYLIEEHSVSLLPSASLGATLESRESPAAGEALFFADPDSDDEDWMLPGAQTEVQAAYQVFRAGPPPFIGPDATKRELLSRASTARLLHLACHNFFDPRVALLSFLKLAGTSSADFLYAFETAELSLSAELVSLSACQSGGSKIETGDEQMGLVRAFLAAGAQSVISTLWAIEDDSAAALFTNFYNYACKYGLAQALAEAQRHLLADPRYELPCFWAPYILSGKWNNKLTFQQGPSILMSSSSENSN